MYHHFYRGNWQRGWFWNLEGQFLQPPCSSKVLPPDQPRPNRPGVGPRDSLSVTLVIAAAIASNKNVSVLGDEILEPEIIKDRMIQLCGTLIGTLILRYGPICPILSNQAVPVPQMVTPRVVYIALSTTTGRPDIARSKKTPLASKKGPSHTW